MTPRLRAAFDGEWDLAIAARDQGDLDRAFIHFERAHILSQRHTWQHMRSHLGMLGIGWRRRDLREIFGQCTRIVAASPFSRVWVPLGNTGGANVSPFRPMPLPADLQALLSASARPD